LNFDFIVALFGLWFIDLRDRFYFIFLNRTALCTLDLFCAKVHIFLTIIMNLSPNILLADFEILADLVYISFKLINTLKEHTIHLCDVPS